MSTYSITLNDKSVQGRALLAYLEALPVQLQFVSTVRSRRQSSFKSSQADIKAGRVTSFESADEMCNALGI